MQGLRALVILAAAFPLIVPACAPAQTAGEFADQMAILWENHTDLSKITLSVLPRRSGDIRDNLYYRTDLSLKGGDCEIEYDKTLGDWTYYCIWKDYGIADLEDAKSVYTNLFKAAHLALPFDNWRSSEEDKSALMDWSADQGPATIVQLRFSQNRISGAYRITFRLRSSPGLAPSSQKNPPDQKPYVAPVRTLESSCLDYMGRIWGSVDAAKQHGYGTFCSCVWQQYAPVMSSAEYNFYVADFGKLDDIWKSSPEDRGRRDFPWRLYTPKNACTH